MCTYNQNIVFKLLFSLKDNKFHFIVIFVQKCIIIISVQIFMLTVRIQNI